MRTMFAIPALLVLAACGTEYAPDEEPDVANIKDFEEEPPPPEEPPPTSDAGAAPPALVVPGSDPSAPVAPGTIRARARATLVSYFSPDDYPASALRDGQQGRVEVTLDVGPDGRVSNCRVRETSGSAALDSATCRILRSRARYTPARNAQGAAIADSDNAAVTWVLPAE